MPDREKLIKALECCLKPDASCVECPYYEETLHTGEMCGYRRKRDALALLKEREETMPRWIPVTERLPEVGTDYNHSRYCPHCGAKMLPEPPKEGGEVG